MAEAVAVVACTHMKAGLVQLLHTKTKQQISETKRKNLSVKYNLVIITCTNKANPHL